MRRRQRESGLSLVEVLVSMAILAVASIVAYKLYDAAQRSFKSGESVTEQQQVARIAFDLISRDLMLAGLNINPDGDRDRPDEAIEAAFEHAIVLRADFDRDDPAKADDPELALAAGAFPVVSTGNDEIRGYALSKQSAGGAITGPDSFAFDVDVGQDVRDGSVETVAIDRVALAPGAPPYTLYRLQLDNDADRFGDAAFITRVPLADNIRSLRFRYYDRAGDEIAPPGGDDSAAARRARASIARVAVEIEALTREPDPQWRDPNDPDVATEAHRKFLLAAAVSPRNLAGLAIRDPQASNPSPSAPAAPTLYAGHCGGLYITWPLNPSFERVSYYRIRYGLDPSEPIGYLAADGGAYYLGGLGDGVPYFVALQAVGQFGDVSELSAWTQEPTANLNAPETPTALTATEDEPGRIDLSWSPVVDNASGFGWDPEAPALRDLAGYRVWRGDDASFPADATHEIAHLVEPSASPAWSDTSAAGCQNHYYRVAAIDACGTAGAPSAAILGRTAASSTPQPPRYFNANYDGAGQVVLTWVAPLADVGGSPIFVDEFVVYRTPQYDVYLPPPPLSSFAPLATVTGTSTVTAPPPPGWTYWYYVAARSTCGGQSDPSPVDHPECDFVGDLVIESPAEGSLNWPRATIRVEVRGFPGPFIRADLRIRNLDSGSIHDVSIPGPDDPFTFVVRSPEDGGTFEPGFYEVVVTVLRDDAPYECPSTTALRFRLAPPE